VGRTVDECIYLFCLLEKQCKLQLLVEAAAANGMPKRVISPEDAAYTQESNGYWETMYNNVSKVIKYLSHVSADSTISSSQSTSC
jgi:hypothetical protein